MNKKQWVVVVIIAYDEMRQNRDNTSLLISNTQIVFEAVLFFEKQKAHSTIFQ